MVPVLFVILVYPRNPYSRNPYFGVGILDQKPLIPTPGIPIPYHLVLSDANDPRMSFMAGASWSRFWCSILLLHLSSTSSRRIGYTTGAIQFRCGTDMNLPSPMILGQTTKRKATTTRSTPLPDARHLRYIAWWTSSKDSTRSPSWRSSRRLQGYKQQESPATTPSRWRSELRRWCKTISLIFSYDLIVWFLLIVFINCDYILILFLP